jgi:hypothetical protein
MYAKKTTSGRMLGMCYILCKIDPMYCTLIWEQRGFGGCLAPPIREGLGVQGGPPEKNFFFGHVFGGFLHPFLVVFRHMVFADGFLILVKELGLLTNWVNGLGVWMPQDPICIFYCKQ